MNPPWSTWPRRWEAALSAARAIGGQAHELEVGGPASLAEIQEIETKLNTRLPEAFSLVLQEFSSSVTFQWFLPEGVRGPFPLDGIFSGGFGWNLQSLIRCEGARKQWADVFGNLEDEYERVFHGKLAFEFVPNGDVLALDLRFVPAPVTFLSHDNAGGHGLVFGLDFIDFIDRASLVGCPGPDDGQMMPFMPSPISGIDPDCENARKWREWFGLTILANE